MPAGKPQKSKPTSRRGKKSHHHSHRGGSNGGGGRGKSNRHGIIDRFGEMSLDNTKPDSIIDPAENDDDGDDEVEGDGESRDGEEGAWSQVSSS
jgi:hypothetical protein